MDGYEQLLFKYRLSFYHISHPVNRLRKFKTNIWESLAIEVYYINQARTKNGKDDLALEIANKKKILPVPYLISQYIALLRKTNKRTC